MFHVTAHALPGRLAISSWAEGAALWRALFRHVRGPVAVCLMPDHVHLLHPHDVRRPTMRALADYAQWRNARHGSAGALWVKAPAAESVSGLEKTRRSVRYIHLNPCRARLVPDPLLWPFSTHLDACGLAVPGVRAPEPDPVSFHAYVSGDPSVAFRGTDLPFSDCGTVQLEQLHLAVAAATRQPADSLFIRRSPARRLFIASARALCAVSHSEVASYVGISRSAVTRVPAAAAAACDPIARIASIPGLAGLLGFDLARCYRGTRYVRRL